jgi:hypothetical protein
MRRIDERHAEHAYSFDGEMPRATHDDGGWIPESRRLMKATSVQVTRSDAGIWRREAGIHPSSSQRLPTVTRTRVNAIGLAMAWRPSMRRIS